ncbi:MAG: hypothetical protein IPG79_10815 [Saprospiraceae bacterium]|nr:hypothetical protein [Saprospiraceae bacterium]
MRPGITGIGSLIFRDEEGIIAKNMPENPKAILRKCNLTVQRVAGGWYFHNISFRTDMKILFLTFWCFIEKGFRTGL